MPIFDAFGTEKRAPSGDYYTVAEIDAMLAALGSGVSVALIEDQKAQNTGGGTFTSGADQIRTLNTLVSDPDSIIDLFASNQFRLLPGDYLIEWSCPARLVNLHQSMLYSVTAGAVIKRGSSEYIGNTTVGVSRSFGAARVSPGVTTAYEIRHRCSTTAVNVGFGEPANLGIEVYTQVKVTRYG